MPTDRTAVTAYLPNDIEKYLTEYCESKGLTRTYKTGETKPVLGTAIIEILEQYFKGDIPDNVPSNVLEETVQKEVEKRLGETNASAVDVEAILEERLEKYHASLENALQGIYERLEALETAPDTAKDSKDDADTETRSLRGATRSRLDELPQRLEKLEAAPTNLDAVLVGVWQRFVNFTTISPSSDCSDYVLISRNPD